METIHLKTVDPVSQDLLRLAVKRGISLNWERYEKLQPQDGFLRLGLSCPYGCMQGPCRIDPFGRGAASGICGIDRDTMVAAMLLRLCLQGVMAALNKFSSAGKISEVVFSSALNPLAAKTLSNFDNPRLSTAEVISSTFLLQRPLESAEKLIEQALRLGLLTLGIMEEDLDSGDSASLLCQAGYGLVAGNRLTIALAGHPNRNFLESL